MCRLYLHLKVKVYQLDNAANEKLSYLLYFLSLRSVVKLISYVNALEIYDLNDHSDIITV